MHKNFDSCYLREVVLCLLRWKFFCVDFYIKKKYPRKFTGFSIGVRTIKTTSVFFNDEIYLSIKNSQRNIAIDNRLSYIPFVYWNGIPSFSDCLIRPKYSVFLKHIIVSIWKKKFCKVLSFGRERKGCIYRIIFTITSSISAIAAPSPTCTKSLKNWSVDLDSNKIFILRPKVKVQNWNSRKSCNLHIHIVYFSDN